MGTLYLRMRIWTYFPSPVITESLEDPKSNSKPTDQLPYHPLLHLLVLNKVLEYSSIKELHKLRLVCSTWNDESCRHLRKRIDHHKIDDEFTFSKLVKLSKKSQIFPIDSFYMKIPRMNKTHLELFRTPLSQNSITTLKIFVSSNDFPILLSSILELRNLKTLVVLRNPEESIESVFLTRDSVLPSRTVGTFKAVQLRQLQSVSFKNSNRKKKLLCNYTSCIVSFLKAAENLNHLEFNYWSTPLTKIFKLSRLPKLKSLVIEGRTLGHMDVTLLSMKKFSSTLRKLEICVDKNVKEETVQELVDSFGAALQEYKIT